MPAWLIGGGLTLIAAAQLTERVPVASAIALIAWGVMQMLQARSAGSLTMAVNFVVYAMLVALAIASQLHATIVVHNEKVTLPLLLDLALAITLLAALLISTCGSETTEDAEG